MRYIYLLAILVVFVETKRVRRQSLVFGNQSPPKNNDQCTTPDDKKGKCTKLFNCPVLFTRLRTNPSNEFISFLRRSICRYSPEGVPIVCCSVEAPSSTTTTTTRRPFFLFGGGNRNNPEEPKTEKPEEPPVKETVPPVKVTEPPVKVTEPPVTEPPEVVTEQPVEETTPVNVEPETRAPVDPLNGTPDKITNPKGLDFLPTECGLPNMTAPKTRIVGGKIAKKGAWPWLAALGYRTSKEIEFLCGGALITRLHILTAAHCVDRRTDLEVIRLGEHDLESTTEIDHEDFPVENIIPHEKYDSANFDNDIAIIRLKKPVTFKKNIIPGCLPIGNIATKDLVDIRAFVAGWGSIAYNNISSPILKEATVPVRSNDDCQKSYEMFRSIVINSQRLCAGIGGNDACQGDSGGPLMIFEGSEDKYFIVGVVSVGFRCAEPEFPGIYARVASYMEWVLEHLV